MYQATGDGDPDPTLCERAVCTSQSLDVPLLGRAGGRDENRPVGREGGGESANVVVRIKLCHGRRSASRRSNGDREDNMLTTLWSQSIVEEYGTDLG